MLILQDGFMCHVYYDSCLSYHSESHLPGELRHALRSSGQLAQVLLYIYIRLSLGCHTAEDILHFPVIEIILSIKNMHIRIQIQRMKLFCEKKHDF